MRSLKLAAYYFSQALKARLAYRLDFLAECLAALAADITGFIGVVIIFQNTPALGEWTRPQAFFIYGLAMLVRSLFGVFAPAFWHFASRYIMDGEFDRLLVRPVDPLLQLFLENVTFQRIPSAVAGFIIVWYAGLKLQFSWGPLDVVLLVAFSIGGTLLLLGLFLGINTTSFWFEDRVGLTPPVYNLMAFGRYPITIFNPTLQFILSFIIPFAFMAFYPATHFLRPSSADNEFALYCYLSPLVGLAVFAGGYAVWTVGIRSYRSTGS